jgi:hypothetical protein
VSISNQPRVINVMNHGLQMVGKKLQMVTAIPSKRTLTGCSGFGHSFAL